jgi:effector-binding domain-containing protein
MENIDISHKKAVILAITACVLWSTAFVTVKYGLAHSKPFSFAGIRFNFWKFLIPAFGTTLSWFLLPDESPEILTLSGMLLVALAVLIFNALFKVVPPIGEIMLKQGAQCRIPEYCFNIYHDGEYREKNIDVEICEAVNEAKEDGEGIVYKKVDAVPEAAVIMHKGGYDSLRKSYSEILSWIEENGYEIVDHPRESYIDGIWNRENPDDWRTEIQIPVKKVQ